LRDAANIVGYHRYGLGWSWNEYELAKKATAPAHEAEARDLGHLGWPSITSSNPNGEQARLNAISSRTRFVKVRLHGFLSRQTVRLRLLGADGRGHYATDRDILDVTFKPNISRSNVVIRDQPPEHARIDGIDLLKSLELLPQGWDKKLYRHDPFIVERLSRDFFESFGLDETNEKIMAWCSEQVGSSRSGKLLLTTSTFHELLKQLRLEYKDSDE
jgi:hypothetical protein